MWGTFPSKVQRMFVLFATLRLLRMFQLLRMFGGRHHAGYLRIFPVTLKRKRFKSEFSTSRNERMVALR